MRRILVMTSLLVFSAHATGLLIQPEPSPMDKAERQQAESLFAKQNFAEALQIYRKLVVAEDTPSKDRASDFRRVLDCLNRLGLQAEFDEIAAEVATQHGADWRIASTLADTIAEQRIQLDGYLIGGKFQRGSHRGGGQYVSSKARDRVWAIQLLRRAEASLKKDTNATPLERSLYYQTMAKLLGDSRWTASWMMQELTDLDELPDYEKNGSRRGAGFRGGQGMFSVPTQPGRGFGGGGLGGGGFTTTPTGAPVNEDGTPVFYQLPDSFEAATNDGERWRWALEQAARANPKARSTVDLEWARFLQQEFGVHSATAPLFGPTRTKDKLPAWVVHELEDTETVAWLATGKKKISLPDEFNPIIVLATIIEREDDSLNVALSEMYQLRMGRHQYPAAARILQRQLEISKDADDRKYYANEKKQITGNWVKLESCTAQVVGEPATVDIRYRNGSAVTFTARPVNIDLLLTDVKAYLNSSPQRLAGEKLEVERIGYRLVVNNESKYLGDSVASWTTELSPPDAHFDAQLTVSTPLNKAGAYLLTAQMQDGNRENIVVWLQDTAITRKYIDAGTLLFVSDAETGAGIAGADIEFFGYNTKRIANTRNYAIETSQRADRTDDNGLCIPDFDRVNAQRTLIIARTKDGRLAYDGFESLWRPRSRDVRDLAGTKVYAMTDRPIYRPGHKVEYRLWVRQPRFQTSETAHANEKFWLQLRDNKNEVLLDQEVTTDRWGGVDGTFELDAAAGLGRYRLQIGRKVPTRRTRNVNGKRETYTEMRFRQIGQGTFVVEEYRKPEYEVTIDAPSEPVKLGERITATVKADYFFGAPVTEATIKYKVNRTPKDSRWFPVARWDWLYSTGYWWFAPDYDWYPGWNRWGCFAPRPFWRGWSPDPPETVLEGEAEIGPDGRYELTIDTAAALEEHGDSDHNYSISVEVVDQSRRTILGNGSVLVARDPFKVFVWPNRGFYKADDTIDVSFQARTPDGKPVAATGTVKLLALSYKDGEPLETEVESWDITTDASGQGKQRMVIGDAGQYRVSVTLKDANGNEREGGYVLYVRGDGNDGRNYRFNDLELITDKREYAPGESVQLQINTNRAGSTVLLFVRPINGICPPPQVLKLDGKSTTQQIAVAKADMPNFYVEAVTISDGRVHSEIREILVPPEQRITNVEVVPGQETYRPGEDATLKLKLTDLDGKPVTGNVVISVYDAALEAIAASQIPEIRKFFWSYRRRHNSNSRSTLGLTTYSIVKPNQKVMSIFSEGGVEFGGMGGGFGGGGGGIFGGAPMAMPRSAPMPMARGMMADSEAAPMEAAKFAAGPGGGGGGGQTVEPTVRSSFADTAFWKASVVADEDGIVEVRFPVPDNLTRWTAKAWAMADGTRVGSGSVDIVSSKDLIIRPQTPRFFTETDQVVLSAVVHNYLDTAKQTTVTLETEGGQLNIASDASQIVTIPADGEVRVDWMVNVAGSGDATVRMLALTDEESDATSLTVPCQVHGILKTDSFAGVIRPGQNSAALKINVPTARIEEQSRLEVRFSPTLAGAMVDALPYLIEYPYGCTEQTLNRFLPAVLTQKTLQKMGVDLADIRDKRTNLNAQELGDPAERARQWQKRSSEAVFDEKRLQAIVQKGVDDLTNMQLSDGGWGWFSGYGEYPSAHLTSQVVHGLTVARGNDVPIVPQVIQKGVNWLKQYQQKELTKLREGDWRKEHPDELTDRKRPWKSAADNLDAFVAFVLCEHDQSDAAMHDYLYRDRGQLSVYGKALTGLVMDFAKDVARRDMLLRNIEQYLETDDENQTAWLRLPQTSWWYWYGSENEAMARYLQLLLRVRPDDTTAPGLVKYLLNNRKHGTYWNSTRDTALVIESMAEYIVATGEDQPDMTVEVLIDGRLQKNVRITGDNLFSFDNVVLLEGDTVKSGEHRIEIRRSGRGPVYFNAYLTNFTKEERIASAGLEVKVQRRFYRLNPVEKTNVVRGDRGQAITQTTVDYERTLLEDLSRVNSGDLIEVELLLDSKNDYEYLLLEDRKPSGFETDDQRSGYFNTGVRTYRELRDDRVSFFINRLARGDHSLTYRIRAEAPGQRISALPAKIEGMYAPELVGNSDEFRLRVGEAAAKR